VKPGTFGLGQDNGVTLAHVRLLAAASPDHQEHQTEPHIMQTTTDEVLGLDSNAVLLSYLIKRDKGRCQVPACLFPSRKVAPLGSSGPMKPSIDHKIPLSKGGTHDLANTQLAHYRCNLSKNNRGGGEQLLLIG
jgi:hypothetical protein